MENFHELGHRLLNFLAVDCNQGKPVSPDHVKAYLALFDVNDLCEQWYVVHHAINLSQIRITLPYLSESLVHLMSLRRLASKSLLCAIWRIQDEIARQDAAEAAELDRVLAAEQAEQDEYDRQLAEEDAKWDALVREIEEQDARNAAFDRQLEADDAEIRRIDRELAALYEDGEE